MDNLTNQQKTIELSTAETVKCDHCAGTLFTPAYMFKRVSAIVSPTGEESLIPVQLYACKSCGEVPEMFLIGIE